MLAKRFPAELDRRLGMALLEREPAVVASAEAMIVQQLLDGDCREA
jgi:hypothetical protein